jgi:hypothetical protein
VQASCVRAIEGRDALRSTPVLAVCNNGSEVHAALAAGRLRQPDRGFALVATDVLPPQGLRHNIVALHAGPCPLVRLLDAVLSGVPAAWRSRMGTLAVACWRVHWGHHADLDN